MSSVGENVDLGQFGFSWAVLAAVMTTTNGDGNSDLLGRWVVQCYQFVTTGFHKLRSIFHGRRLLISMSHGMYCYISSLVRGAYANTVKVRINQHLESSGKWHHCHHLSREWRACVCLHFGMTNYSVQLAITVIPCGDWRVGKFIIALVLKTNADWVYPIDA